MVGFSFFIYLKVLVKIIDHFFSESPDNVQVVVGRHSIQSSEENDKYSKEYKVKKIILHPYYDSNTMENDVAIMYLTEDVVTNPGVQPIELSDQPSVKDFNKDCVISGWGALTEGLLIYTPRRRTCFIVLCHKWTIFSILSSNRI